MKDLMDGIVTGKRSAPTFEEGYHCQAVLDAVERSAESRGVDQSRIRRTLVMATPHVTVWNEYRHERSDEKVAKIYPHGIHGALAALMDDDLEVRTATLDEPDHGLTEEVLDATDVLLWWGHTAHGEVADEVVERVHEQVLGGMGLIVLHSGHFSKIFKRLMGTSCDLKWRHDDRERLWVVTPGHQIAEGVGEYIELEEEMYGEPFDVPPPEELVFVSWFGGGEVFRSGCCYRRGRGRIFYFRPGHETNASYHNPDVGRVIRNAVRWAAPTPGKAPAYGHTEPLE
jgi:trehalose utilization protein